MSRSRAPPSLWKEVRSTSCGKQSAGPLTVVLSSMGQKGRLLSWQRSQMGQMQPPPLLAIALGAQWPRAARKAGQGAL